MRRTTLASILMFTMFLTFLVLLWWLCYYCYCLVVVDINCTYTYVFHISWAMMPTETGGTNENMYVCTSATTLSLTETIPIAMIFPFCCQVSTTCKHLCFPIIPKFKELYNELFRNGIKFALFWLIKKTHSDNINKISCFFLREVKNVCDNNIHHNVNI